MFQVEYLGMLSKDGVVLDKGYGHGEGQGDVTDEDIRPGCAQSCEDGV